jgi:multidrug efflux system membrane fusion protein
MKARSAWILLSLAVPLCGCRREHEVAAKPPALVSLYVVQDQTEGATVLRYSGSVKPHTQVSLAFKVSGYLRDILRRQGADGRSRLLQQGDRVARGAVLAQVQQADYTTRADQAQSQLQGAHSTVAQARSQLAESRASREQARAAVTEAESAKQSAESQLAEARTTLQQAQAGLAEAQAGKRQAQAALAEAEAGFVKAKLDFERATNLFASQSLTKTNYDAAKAQADATQAQVDQARQQIESLEAKEEAARSQIETAQARIAGATAQVKTSEARIDEAKAQLQASEEMVRAAGAQVGTAQAQASAARAQLEAARIPVRDTLLRAPLDAVVLQRNVEVGTFVAAGTVGFVLADTRSVKVVFGVPDVEMRLVRPGMSLTITTEAYPGREFRGRVTAISPSADPKSRVFDVEVTVPNPRGQLKSGLITTLELPAAARSEPLLTLPIAAIVASRRSGQGYAVFVVEDQAGKQVARARDVTLGPTVGNMVAVQGGVKAGERVVTTGAPLLIDGETVQVVE